MIRGSDPFWCYVEKMADGFLKCVYCGSIFAGSTSISRIKYHLARVKGGGVKLCEKVTPDVQRAAFDQLPNRMHGSMPSSSKNIIVTAGSDRAQDLEMQGQPLLDDELSSWMNSLIGGEILLADENVAPVMPMPDAPETGLGTEPADQPFEMDMNKISSSLMRDVEFSSGTEKMTWGLMQSVAERGSSSERPVDRSVPSSSNNEATNAASTPVRGLAIEQEQPRLDDGLGWMDILSSGETELVEEPRAPVVLMTYEPETRQRTEKAHQFVAERGSSSKWPIDRSVPSSSNNEATNAASTPVPGIAIEQPRLDDGLGGMDILNSGETGLVEEPRAPDVVMTDEPGTRQRTEQAHQSFEMNTESISSMIKFYVIYRNIMSPEYKHFVFERGSSSESRAHKRRRTRRYVLPTTKLVGQAFERNMKDVWSWLSNDEVSCIGIYGMGGVGKTALATHIHNRLHQERQDIFHHVCWITVSQDFSIKALQDCIVKYFDLDLGDEEDAVVRAGKLLTELIVKKKYVLILDDLWDHFPLEKVGIPLRTDGCKLVFTTRSLDICTKMDCQRIIKVEPLSEGEAWNLFVEKLGHGARLFPETKQIVESIVKECAGLPLGIMTMAGSMKGVKAEYRWRDALRRLRISEVGPVTECDC